MSSVSPSVSNPSSNPDLVINPIYSRSFAKDFAWQLEFIGVRKVKHAYLLAVHDALVRESLAFPGLNPRTLEKAVLLAYETLSGFDVRVGKKNACEAAREVLYNRSAFLRKPLYVPRSEAHNEALLQGEGLDDNHWCVTQWVPWMLQEGQALMDEIMSLVGGEDGEDPPYVKLSRDELLLAADQVKCMIEDLYSLVELIGDSDVGRESLLAQEAFLNRVDSFVALHQKCVLARIATPVPAGAVTSKPNTDSMESPSQDELESVFKNTRMKVGLASDDFWGYGQDLHAMKKESSDEIFGSHGPKVKIALQVVDQDNVDQQPVKKRRFDVPIDLDVGGPNVGTFALGSNPSPASRSPEDPDSDFEITVSKKGLDENSQGALEQDLYRHCLMFGATRDGMSGIETKPIEQAQSPFAVEKVKKGTL